MAKPGPWAIYPEAMASDNAEVEAHAMIWFDDPVTANRYAMAESSHTVIRHHAYLVTPPAAEFAEFRPGILVKSDSGRQQAINRLNFLSRVLSEGDDE